MTVLLDPRPLVGEPLALDLLNTRWRSGEGIADLLALPDGLETWLASNGLSGRATADSDTLTALLKARDALKQAVDAHRATSELGLESESAAESAESLEPPQNYGALDEVLRHGRIRRAAGSGGPVDTVEVDGPGWLPAWLAVDSYLALLAGGAERIRGCAGDRCVLHFYDTSQNGRRRWCSMARCGNRAKASRHYAQERRRLWQGRDAEMR
jgi:predicted RNA-binding Zn ribbon-like protein